MLQRSISGPSFFLGTQTLRYVSKKLSGKQANDYCKKHYGGSLVVVDSNAKRDQVAKIAKSDSVWIGLFERSDRKTWETPCGHVNRYQGWAKGQPQPEAVGAKEEDCAVQFKKFGNKWHDYPCKGFTYPFVCEVKSKHF